LNAKLGSITDTLTLTGEYAYANVYEVRLRALTYLARLAPGVFKDEAQTALFKDSVRTAQ